MLKDRLLTTCSFKELWEKKGDNGYPKAELAYFRCDWEGHWWNTVWPINREWETPELVKEFDGLKEAFFREIPTFDAMVRFCEQHCEKIGKDEYNAYFEGEHGLYWFRFIARYRDYNLYLHCYSRAARGQ